MGVVIVIVVGHDLTHRILVLDHGCKVEFGTPWELLQDPAGSFRDLCRQSGEEAQLFEVSTKRPSALFGTASDRREGQHVTDPTKKWRRGTTIRQYIAANASSHAVFTNASKHPLALRYPAVLRQRRLALISECSFSSLIHNHIATICPPSCILVLHLLPGRAITPASQHTVRASMIKYEGRKDSRDLRE